MKRLFTVLIAISLIAAIPALLSSCGGETVAEPGTTVAEPGTTVAPTERGETEGLSAAEEPTAADVSVVYEPRAFTQRDAYELFKDVYSQGTHHEYLEYVGQQAEEMKEKAAAVYDEIIELLEVRSEEMSRFFNRTAEECFEEHAAPFKEYYGARLEMPENAEDAYAGISALVCQGGTAGADIRAQYRYAYYRNLYDELCGVRDTVS